MQLLLMAVGLPLQGLAGLLLQSLKTGLVPPEGAIQGILGRGEQLLLLLVQAGLELLDVAMQLLVQVLALLKVLLQLGQSCLGSLIQAF
ncbi:MAG: hypothetical protein Q6K99_02710 [Thermostichales cyanobacterium BF4_bins_65]